MYLKDGFGKSLNNALPDILKQTHTQTLSYGNMA